MTWLLNTVADSFALLPLLSDGSVDHVITDPPYDAHCQQNQCSGTIVREMREGRRPRGVPKIELPFQPVDDFAFTVHLPRIARRWALCFYTLRSFGKIEMVVGKRFVREGIWYKPNSMGQLTGDRPAAACEGIAIMHAEQEKLLWNGNGSYGFWACNGTRGEPNRHPNQKPLQLLLHLVNLFTDPGETVFDPFAGSGRIGEACLLLGRHYVGLELEPALASEPVVHVEWLHWARLRLTAAQERFGSLIGADLNQCRFKKGELL